MTTKKPDSDQPATNTTPADAAAEAATHPTFGDADPQGRRWKTEPVGKQVRVHVLLADGTSLNTLAATEAAGRKALEDHLK
ncbi:hypothetical protein [Deinococcus sp. UR1]|uniref:hypothetical protein n=1 Tax=Deinococcus sp. UR1 TaxID=1704277 RepID=UPI0006DBEBB8|nr:hypothetical protein [Deinococcus sp. UR1]PIG98935.1 hypothetical protein AMD26_006695 [Deinococcus sp. UR1]